MRAGRLKFHHEEWTKITSDKVILDIVKGYHIDFISVPFQNHPPKQPLDKHEEIALNALFTELIQKGAIERCAHEDREFISPDFLRPEKNGKHRLILNLKRLNTHLPHIHLKMDTLQSCNNLMKQNCTMGSLNLTISYN